MVRLKRTKKALQILSRSLLASLLLVAWFSPAAQAQIATCESTDEGWECTINVDTLGEGPVFTFVLTEETLVTVKTYTSLTCDTWEDSAENGYADPYLYLYDENNTLLFEDDDGSDINNGVNFCWDAMISETLDAGSYSLRADAYDESTIGTYSLDISGGEWSGPE